MKYKAKKKIFDGNTEENKLVDNFKLIIKQKRVAHAASQNGHIKVVQWLVRHGKSVAAKTKMVASLKKNRARKPSLNRKISYAY